MSMFTKKKIIRFLLGGLLLLLFFLPWRELVLKNKVDEPQTNIYSGWDEASPVPVIDKKEGIWGGAHFPANHLSYKLIFWFSFVFLIIGTTLNWHASKTILFAEIFICVLSIWLLALNGPRDLVIFKTLSGLISHRLLVPFWLTLIVLVTILANDIAALVTMKHLKKDKAINPGRKNNIENKFLEKVK